MSGFLLQRLMQALLLLLIVSMIGFAILHLAPGGPLSQFALRKRWTDLAMVQGPNPEDAAFAEAAEEGWTIVLSHEPRRPVGKLLADFRQDLEQGRLLT